MTDSRSPEVVSDEDRAWIRSRAEGLIDELATQRGLAREAVSDIVFLFLQKHPKWGRNPSKAQKRAAYLRWGGVCQNCHESVELGKAIFHHAIRRVPGQHDPENLLPYHDECHNRHHGVSVSLTKGAPAKSP